MNMRSRATAGVLLLLVGVVAASTEAGKDVTSVTRASLWPLPLFVSYGTGSALLPASGDNFSMSCPAGPLNVLPAACDRFKALVYPPSRPRRTAVDLASPTLTSLHVFVEHPSADLGIGVNESYTLNVEAGGATLHADTVWGAMHGLETLYQLIQVVSGALQVIDTPVFVQDVPRFSHRGILLDSARHYQPVSLILHAIDALAMNKMNVLHWHVVDAQSFPMKSTTFPDLSDGAFAPYLTFSAADVQEIVAYGHARGVRVVPEFDVPGHAYSWGIGYPNITATCPGYAANINNIPLNPCEGFTFDVLKGFLAEMMSLFPDQMFHVGGDEVVYGCWAEDPSIQRCMQAKGFTNYNQLMQFFVTKNDAFVLNANRIPVHWEEVFDDGIQVDPSAVFQVWKSHAVLASIVKAGHRAILSNSNRWYLNCGFNPLCEYQSWQNVYTNDPFANMTLTPAQKSLLLGGETAMWAEFADQTNWDPQVWPRNSAAAERLWSAEDVTNIDDAEARLAYHRCRMVHRGVDASPITVGFCPEDIFP